ncbi:MAG: DUF2085 domain-containing protein [Caldilineaceae bacterium]|nr:DUF2085 domain-containing protein [Caldilineaceae bacterium]
MSRTLEGPKMDQAGRPVEVAFARRFDGLIVSIARRWLALVNGIVALFLFLPILAPVLAKAGLAAPASFIYAAYSVTCHQLPESSYFLFGGQPLYSLEGLEANGLESGLNLFQRRQFQGDPATGYKVAIGQRNLAIYASILLAGLTFGLVRGRIRPPSFKIYLLCLVPMALDGFSQLFGLRDSNWWLRTVTGALFGISSVWLAYPFLESAMRSVRQKEAGWRSRPATAIPPRQG